LITFLGFFTNWGHAVEPNANDSVFIPSSEIKWYDESQLANPAIAEPNFVDTTLNKFQRYEFAYRERSFYSHKGNVGHGHRNLEFDPLAQSYGFSYLRDNIYKGNLFSHDNIKFYRPEYVFTDLYYVTAGRSEQLFYALHSQRLSDNLVMSMKYQLTRAPGVYRRIKSNNANLYGSVDYVSDDERYQLLSSFIWNRMINEESGGLTNPEEFEEDEDTEEVMLHNAEGRYRETEINLNQYYQLGFHRNSDNKSVDNENQNYSGNNDRFVDLGRISLKSSYNRQSYLFEENESPYDLFEGFPNTDSLQTYDSTIVHNISNKIGYSNFRLDQKRMYFPLFFDLSIKHDFYSIHHPFNLKNEFDQFTYDLNVNTDRERRFSFGGFYNYISGGYNDRDLSTGISGKIDDIGQYSNQLNMNLSYHEKQAPFIMNNFFSNYVFWTNDLDKAKITNAGLNFGNSNLSVDLNIFHLDNWHYFDKEALPQQADQSFEIASAGLKSTLGFGVFKFDNHIIYQYLSDDSYEQFPDLVSYHSIYADLVLFDKSLYGHVGFDIGYNSPYFAPSYMPVYKQFHVQQDYETSHQVFLDMFANVKISRARLFVKWQNLGSLLWDQPVIYTIPYYPIPEAEIRFGVSWMFYD